MNDKKQKLHTEVDHFSEYVESGICPDCGEKLERVFDRVSNDPVLDECIEIKCTDCNWSDERLEDEKK